MANHVISPLYACSFELTHDEYQTRYNELTSDGYRLIMVDGYRSGNDLKYGGIWIRDEVSKLTAARHGLSSSEYQDQFDDLRFRGYAIKGVTGLSSVSGSTQTKFAAVWNDGSSRDHHAHHDMTASGYQSKFDEYQADGYQIIYVTGYAQNNSSRYAAIWSRHASTPRTARHNLPAADYQSTFDTLKSQGYRIAHVNAHEAGNQTYFAGIWIKEDGYNPIANHNKITSDFQQLCYDNAAADRRLICIGGYREKGKDKYTGVWIPHTRTWLVQGRAGSSLAQFDSAVKSFMQDRKIPGGSLAISKNGKLVLARGYSWITDIEVPVQPTSLFRIASITKTLTGAAIMRLVDDGLLTLNSAGQLSDKLINLIDMPGTITDNRIKQITVDHLLHHVAGWDREATGVDPMNKAIVIADAYGMSLPITQQAIIRWMNENYVNKNGEKGKLDFDPGTDPGTTEGYAYSNYGYMLLGQVIESVSGLNYEEFVQNRILQPLGIHRMRLGKTLLRQKVPNEVLYHSMSFNVHNNIMDEEAPQNVMLQYGGYFSLETGQAHGGWIASAVDLVKFASSLDDAANCPILSASSVNRLFAKAKYFDAGATSYYGGGWYIRVYDNNPEQYHGGLIEGTTAHICKWQDKANGDSFNAAVIFNKYDEAPDWDMHELIRSTVDKIKSWPTDDFWEDYF